MRVSSVSYTHLDVYKRQALPTPANTILSAGKPALIAARISPPLTQSAPNPLSRIIVSQNYRLVVSSVGYGTKYVDISLSGNEKNKDLGTSGSPGAGTDRIHLLRARPAGAFGMYLPDRLRCQ